MGRKLSIVVGWLIFNTLLCSLPLGAQTTKIDFVLSGKYDGGKIYLKWIAPSLDSVRMYFVYRGLSPMLPAFVRIDSTAKTELIDQPPSPVTPPFSYYVVAAMKNGSVRYSNTIEIRTSEIVRITSIPRETGALNTLYTYQVTATSSDPSAILKYQLTIKPERMAIDTVTGLVTWTPQQKGIFKVVVLVSSLKGGRAEQSFATTVSGPTGTVAGVVTDPLGKPVASVAILLSPRIAAQNAQYKGYTDLGGKYTIGLVDSGSYVARAIPALGDYPEQWYDGVTSAEKATVFSVMPNTTSTVDFKLGAKNDVVRITSRPAEIAALAVPYSYQVMASSSDPSAVLKYQLTLKPDGMAIDSLMGIVSWIPNQRGIYKVGIVVVSSKGGRADQSFGITVSGPAGTVAGSVKDSLSRPIAGIYIQLYQVSGVQKLEFKSMTDSGGRYSIAPVDSGTYIARAIPSRGDFAEQWYNGAATVDKATPFVVVSNGAIEVNFTLKTKAVPSQFTVGGVVLDESKKGVREATVVFTSTVIVPGEPNSSMSPNGMAEYVYKVRVDSSGKYLVKLPQNTYTVMASGSGFATMFFDGKSDLLSANPIRLTKDTSGISFTLKKISSVATGKISGSVVDSATKAGLRSKVLAYRIQSTKIYLDGPGVYPSETDSTGVYTIANMLPGDYIVLALPLGYYAPTYYSLTGSTTNWERATKININGNSVTGITIVAKPLVKTMRGYNSIFGVVSVSGTGGEGPQTGNAAGAIVYALVNSEDVAGFGITDENGSFAIEELAPGSYTLVVNKVNFVSPASAKASSVFNSAIDANVPPATAFLTISPVVFTAVAEEGSSTSGFVLEQNYPNPFNPTTNFAFRISNFGFISLKVFDVLGREVASLVQGQKEAGSYSVQWNASDLPSGIYLYRLSVVPSARRDLVPTEGRNGQAGGYVATRKMILTK